MADCVETSTLGTIQQDGATDANTKTVMWGTLRAGDCEQNDGTLVFESTGFATFSCTTLTYSTSSGDIWHAKFEVHDAGGLTLFQTAEFDSPEMDDGNPPPRYSWSKDFIYDGQHFAAIAAVTQHYSC